MNDVHELTNEQLAIICAARNSMIFAGHAISEETALVNGREFFARGLDERAREHARNWQPEGSDNS